MEPLFFKAENTRWRLCRWQRHRLQWSRFFSKRKIFSQPKKKPYALDASMEPLFFKAENSRHRAGAGRDNRASMEPLFFKAENIGTQAQALEFLDASMEPLFFKAENLQFFKKPCGAFRMLQWSRFFSKRKMCYWVIDAPAVIGASMEPLFFKVENPSPPETHILPNQASMEPLFFKAENPIVRGIEYAAATSRFNGAAFFQSGKYLPFVGSRYNTACFNGAAFFQSGKS